MRLLFSIIFSILFFISVAQDRQIRRSEKLFEKGKYEKCISKTKKYLKKYHNNADLQLLVVKSNMALYHEKKDSRKFYQLKKTLRSRERLLRYSLNEKDFPNLDQDIKEMIYQQLSQSKISEQNIDYLSNQLAENFGDTITYFRKKYLKDFEQAFVQDDPGPVFDSLSGLDSLRRILLTLGLKQLGVPYKYGGIDSTGFDCSGFTQFIYKNIGIELPHNAQLQSELGQAIDLEKAQTGDLIFFGKRRAAHAAMIFINSDGEPELIHCVSRGVSYDTEKDNNHIYWMNRPYQVKRFLDYEKHIKNK